VRTAPNGLTPWRILLLGLWALASSRAAQAQESAGDVQVKISGFVNLTGGFSTPDDRVGLLPEGEVEITPQLRTPEGTIFAARAAFNVNGLLGADQPGATAAIPEFSLFAIGSFGRIEVGSRAGFPQSLLGFTPSEIAFTAAEFGPDSGTRLDPNGQLPTRFLPAALAARFNALTYLGYAERWYGDASPKAIYLTPRMQVGTDGGVYAALSYTPQSIHGDGLAIASTEQSAAGGPVTAPLSASNPKDLAQGALVYGSRGETLDWSAGLTWSHARLNQGPTFLSGETNSLALGANVSIKDTWHLGLSATWDGLSERRPDLVRHVGGDPFGVVASVNYIDGPWVIGGYWQYAAAAATLTAPTRDRAQISEIGVSYLLDQAHDRLGPGHYTDLKLYAAISHYDLRSATANEEANAGSYVLTAGLRFSFF
jgi:hypothetical protein